jgi:sirohydrochlorin cobaltochelatase
MDEPHGENIEGLGLLLVGHGTREPRGVDEFLTLAASVARQLPQWSVAPSFLEFARPKIDEGFRALAARGVSRLVVAPVMLFSAGHVQHDIPEAVRRIACEHASIAVSEAAHFGCQEELVELSQLRFEQTIAGRAPLSPDETALVMGGRGSHDPLATADMLRFAELRGAQSAVSETRACFVALADPRLEATLDALAESRYRRIVVQPHLLFYGLLLDRIAQLVESYAQRYPRQEWVVAPHLGSHELVAQAIVRRAAPLAAAFVS